MNERIKELYEKAQYKEEVFGGGFGGPNLVKKLDPEKFAELIVRECIQVVDDTMTENQEMNIGLVMASAKIVAHFGVEE